ncbi:Hypothetical_protein [Hexamita inflata]|uniref:Hypothetical_protein n=1 Tax=Hexamita inflata TaxID=28002 RepID=A0AA86TQ78_9EUKA|nr:Hypothetical protein HINF_LOCUS11895 [Hexamita inflata]
MLLTTQWVLICVRLSRLQTYYEYTPQQSVQPVSQQLVSPVLIPVRKPNVEIAQFTKTSYRERKSYSIEFKRDVLEIYDRYRLHFKGNAAKKTTGLRRLKQFPQQKLGRYQNLLLLFQKIASLWLLWRMKLKS